jgi:hypothetical protein
MGHSDNYIPANPMQTPPSIYNIIYIGLSATPIITTSFDNNIEEFKSILSEKENIKLSKSTMGNVRINDTIVSISLSELQSMMSKHLVLAPSIINA